VKRTYKSDEEATMFLVGAALFIVGMAIILGGGGVFVASGVIGMTLALSSAHGG